jgi:hypothetical protein
MLMSEPDQPGETLDENIVAETGDENPQVQEGQEPSEANEGEDDKSDDTPSERKKLSRTERMERRYGEQLRRQQEEIEVLKKMVSPTKGPETVKPKMADFDSVEDFVEAREAYTRQELLKELRTTTTQENKQQAAAKSYEAKVREVKKEYKDWDDVMEDAADEPTARDTVEFCLESEIGPKIAYYLAKYPDEHERLNALSSTRRLAELGKLEDKLSKPVVKVITKAPGKLSEVKGTTVVSTDPGVAARTGGYKAWKAADELRRASKK